MEQQSTATRNRGGRPKKSIKKDQVISVKATLYERKAIEAKAKNAGISISEYLREMGLTGKIDRRIKTLPKEILALTATLNHLAANLNQIARKRNGTDELNSLERASLTVQSGQLKELAAAIKAYLQP